MNARDRDPVASAVMRQDWGSIEDSLNSNGNALLPGLLAAAQCEELVAMYPQDQRYRSRIVMARHGFGLGEYKYFAYPLPGIVAQLRSTLYPYLAPIANRWNELTGTDVRYPQRLQTFLDRCHAAGQTDSLGLARRMCMRSDQFCANQKRSLQVAPLIRTIFLVF